MRVEMDPKRFLRGSDVKSRVRDSLLRVADCHESFCWKFLVNLNSWCQRPLLLGA